MVSMQCGNFPKVQYQLLRAHVKMVLWTLSCFKELGCGNGDGNMEIAQTFSISPATLWANAWRSETPREQGKSDHPASSTKPCKYHVIPSKSLNFPGKFQVMFIIKCVRRHGARRVFFKKCLTASAVSHPPGCFWLCSAWCFLGH